MTKKHYDEAVAYLRSRGVQNAEVGIVLGTGLGWFTNYIEIKEIIEYTDIPHFPEATVEMHKGKLIYGKIGDKMVLAMQGRFHYYEGYSMQQITFPVRVMRLLGIGNLLLSNAAGGLNLQYKKGDLILIEDHINLLPDNPLIGKNINEFGPRFPDMSQPYSIELNTKLLRIAMEESISLKQGVYVSVAGPNLETRAEYRFLRLIGADVVGMSTVPEVIVANQMSLPCATVSVITDECDPDNLQPISIEEIIEVASRADKKLSLLFKKLIEEL
jgi:purine-nucleoside phosphorylase